MESNTFEHAIIKRVEHSLIHNRIKCTYIKTNHLQTKIASTKTFPQQKLDYPSFTNLQNIIFNNKEKIFLHYKNAQIKKLNHLISRAFTTISKMASKTANTFNTTVTSSIWDKWVSNLSKKELIPEEKSLLQKGLTSAVTPVTIPIKEYICTTTEVAIQTVDLNSVDFIVSTIMSIEFVTPTPVKQHI